MLKNVVPTVALIFALTAAIDLPVLARADPGWIGKRVVPKRRRFALLVNGETVESSGKAIDIYRVEQSDGPLLLLKAETPSFTGWAAADDVVVLENAVDFFTQQIRARPQDAFLHAGRALVWRDKQIYANALRDYDEAIRLDPRNATYYHGRGLVRIGTNEHDRAIDDFGEAIRLDPKSAPAFIARALARSRKNDYSRAIADDSEAIWLDPLAIAAYENRGLAWYAKREFAKAIVDFNLVVRLDPIHAIAHCNRGDAWVALANFERALADFKEAIQIDETCIRAHRSRAWIWSTCPDARFRDGKNAVESATRACELSGWKDPHVLGVLAAAYAESGDFESAVTWQTRANSLHHGDEQKAKGQLRLKLYEAKQPLRVPIA